MGFRGTGLPASQGSHAAAVTPHALKSSVRDSGGVGTVRGKDGICNLAGEILQRDMEMGRSSPRGVRGKRAGERKIARKRQVRVGRIRV